MTYYLNIWQESKNSGTSPLFKTDDKQEFKLVLKEMMKRYIPYKSLCKITKYKDFTFVSYCDGAQPFATWYIEKPKGKINSMEIVNIDKLELFL